ncbi:MAG: MogA/MoaB family molybdenum cofactor biosynthesis protein, partial [Candidatus Heimdallarchaeaceae archaeon]
QLDGFGELFRSLTFEQVGTVSIMTRALAGIIKQSLVVSLPGSPNAVRLGIDIILKELMHILNLISK